MKKTTIAILSLSFLFGTGTAHAAVKPLNNKDNKSSCSYIKSKYKTSSMSSWSNGELTDQEFMNEIDGNISILSKRILRSNGSIKQQIKLWNVEEKNTKQAILEANGEQLISSMDKKIKIVSKFNKLCKSIGK